MNNKSSRYHVQYNEAKDFFQKMKETYPLFKLDDFKKISLVAFPIVNLEIDVLEKTMENFSIVEKTLLKMIQEGNIDRKLIAKELGITITYVDKVVELLKGYEQVDDRGITQLGIDSLNQDASIKQNWVKQRIQVNGVTGEPVYISEFVSEKELNDPKKIGTKIAYIPMQDGVKLEDLKKSLTENYSEYIDDGGYCLHTNVEEIKEVKYLDYKYTKAFYLCTFDDKKMIMCKSYNAKAEDVKDRFCWKPLFTNDKKLLDKYEIESEGIKNNDKATSIINSFNEQLSMANSLSDYDIMEILNKLYEFDWQHTKLTRNPNKQKGTVLMVRENSFINYDKIVLKMLESLSDERLDIMVFEELYGECIQIKTHDLELLKLADYYNSISKRVKRTNIMKRVETEYNNNRQNVIPTLKKVLKEIENEL